MESYVTLMSLDIWKAFLTITLIHSCNFALANFALNQLPRGPDGPDLRGLSQSLSLTLMSVDMWQVFQTITLTHPTNFAFVNIALNHLPGGPDGPDPPDGAGAAGVHFA